MSACRDTAATGHASTLGFPDDPDIDPSNPTDDPDILDFVKLRDAGGRAVAPGSPKAQEDAVRGVRRAPLAARLKAIYGDVDKLDAFVGMVSEPHLSGTEFGKLQLRIWKQQFRALRDGDRFFYRNDPRLVRIKRKYGVNHRPSLAKLIKRNTGAPVAGNVFKASGY